jgi:hypothetical protein
MGEESCDHFTVTTTADGHPRRPILDMAGRGERGAASETPAADEHARILAARWREMVGFAEE